ncbi:hypothetical protein F4825DRAFT_450179 [Nemania diffusa]|nr:hypothetical protein F4825DRAFT_450179 [Nemania diffusa]
MIQTPLQAVSGVAHVPKHQPRILIGFLSKPAPNQLAHSPLSASTEAQRDLLDCAFRDEHQCPNSVGHGRGDTSMRRRPDRGSACGTRRGAVLGDVGGSTGHASATPRAFPDTKAEIQGRAEVSN